MYLARVPKQLRSEGQGGGQKKRKIAIQREIVDILRENNAQEQS